ncbi:hypothetical protein [Lacticaseibacillus saniviri]
MELNNNQLVKRYLALQSQNADYFKAIDTFVNTQVQALYDTLETTFADTVLIDIDDAMAYAKDQGQQLTDPASEETATVNYILKDLDSLGLLVEAQHNSDPNTIVGKINFGNQSRYY